MTFGNLRHASWAMSGLAAVMGLTLSAGTARAQSAYYDEGYYGPPATTGELVVVAPRTVGRSAIGAPIQVVREQRVVYADDLDLGTPWGAHVLKQRIERAARDACSDLDARYPITIDSGPDCVTVAVRDAMYRTEDALGFTPPTWPYG